MSWKDVESEAPELAAAVRARFEARKHATMATLRADGSPRISGTEVAFADGEVVLGSMPGAVKARDLQRDPRIALHSPTVDPPEENPSDWAGEAKISGTAQEVPGEGEAHLFHLHPTEVVLTTVSGDKLVIEHWHPGRGVQRTTR